MRRRLLCWLSGFSQLGRLSCRFSCPFRGSGVLPGNPLLLSCCFSLGSLAIVGFTSLFAEGDLIGVGAEEFFGAAEEVVGSVERSVQRE